MFAFVGSFSLRPSFCGAALTAPRISTRPTISMAVSKSVPFLEKPSKLDGSLVGDVGFDPLYLSDYINLDYAATSEVKHGRICMLAALGMLVQEIVHLPNPMYAEPNPLKAIYSVPVEAWVQIILVICLIELATFKKTYEDGADLGFDPLNMGKGGNLKELQLKEVKNGRLAMIATVGFIMQTIASGKPIFAQLGSAF